MEITIDTNRAATYAKNQAKSYVPRLALVFMSAGWLAPLFAVLTIPADIAKQEGYWLMREADATRRFAEAKGGEVRQDVFASAKGELDLVQKQRALAPQRQREMIGYYETACIILCVWLGLAIGVWSWMLYPLVRRMPPVTSAEPLMQS